VAGAEEMGRAEGDADKAGIGVGDLEALSNERPTMEGEEHRMAGTHGGPATNGCHPPTARITQKLPR
jgi:hypothetical protein